MRNKDVEAFSDNPREVKMIERRRNLTCGFCKPHRGENSSSRKGRRIKKAFQLDPARRHRAGRH
jgi:hypothetical protein